MTTIHADPLVSTPTLRAADLTGQTVWDDAFWARFCRESWQREPVLYTRAAPDVLDQHEVFSAVVAVCDAYRRRPGPKMVNFYLDAKPQTDFTALLPRASDGSAAGYHQRMDQTLSGRDYTLLVAEIHAYDEHIWRVARSLLERHYAHAGHPADWRGWVDTALFLGRYRRTPFGVHEGPMDVMTFPLIGVKRFRTWTPQYVAAHEEIKDRREYDEHLPASGLLEVAPGDVSYWPASTFHIAEGGEEFTMAWSLGMWRKQASHAPARFITDILKSLLEAHAEEPPPSAPHVTANLPASWAAALHHASDCFSIGAVEDALTLGWLRMQSGWGFKVVPPLRPFAAAGDAVMPTAVRRSPDANLHWRPLRQQPLAVACRGHVQIADNTAYARQLLSDIAAGNTVPLPPNMQHDGRIAEGVTDDLGLMRFLLAAGAVEAVT